MNLNELIDQAGYMTLTDLACKLGVSSHTLYWRIHAGQLKTVRLGAKTHLIERRYAERMIPLLRLHNWLKVRKARWRKAA